VDLAEQITMPIRRFEIAANLGHQRVYDLIASGAIESVLIGQRRYIIVRSYLDYLDRLKHQQATEARRPSPNPRARIGRQAAQ